MKTTIGLAALFLGVFLAFLLQQSIPAINFLHGARIVFIPMLFCYAAMVLPFPAMLVAAFYTGLLTDLMYLHVVGGQVEIALGWSIVYFVIFGSIANGFQSGMQDDTWWPFIPLSALGTSAFLLLQFIMITLRRQEFVFEGIVLWRILTPGVVAAIIAPLFYMGVRPFRHFFSTDLIDVRGY